MSYKRAQKSSQPCACGVYTALSDYSGMVCNGFAGNAACKQQEIRCNG